ncbi:unnamed protein product [Enterobius vermicularis]|uniref:DDE_Tnp_IS1595 domain-containing protein n=1 Tax=Enterobius vermicularis TaxID=51028 RepID=A0A0N4V100_ENTVE|nr:unnamed protein product [Enterobius vermicularis]
MTLTADRNKGGTLRKRLACQYTTRLHWTCAGKTGSTISSTIIVSYFKAFRYVCVSYFNARPVKLNGPGKVVGIDETVLACRKNNKGKLFPHQWCFGGIGMDSNECFIVAVEYRDAATLVPLVRQYILSGTTVMSDKWAAYDGSQDLPERYQHLTVNHKLHFIDPLSGACTNTIESLWQKFKKGHKERYGTLRTLLDRCHSQFMWKKLFKEDPLYHLWFQISEFCLASALLQDSWGWRKLFDCQCTFQRSPIFAQSF